MGEKTEAAERNTVDGDVVTTYSIPRETWTRPSGTVWACFESCFCDAPILRGTHKI